MPRYVMKFSKGGYTKYISHLDLLRVFKRAFKVMGLDIRYSQGYNPHPKMGFAQPLSLGYSSRAEYLEFETVDPHDPKEILDLFSGKLPEDVEILDLFRFDDEVKSLAAETVACRYLIFIPTELDEAAWKDILDSYLSRTSIKAMKKMKKTNRFARFLALGFALVLAGCAGAGSGENDPNTSDGLNAGQGQGSVLPVTSQTTGQTDSEDAPVV